MKLKWIEPQSRWVLRVLFHRQFDAFIPSAQVRVNWAMLVWDIVIAWFLLGWLFS